MPGNRGRWGFDQWAKSYDEDIAQGTHSESWIFEDYERVLGKVVEYCDLSKNNCSVVLDIGIGTGNLASLFLNEGLTVVGIDPSEKMRKACERKYPDMQIKDGDFLNIPLRVSSVDVIVSSYAFHHLVPEQKETAVSGMKGVLRANGRIVIADLMFNNVIEKQRIVEKLRQSGRDDIVDTIEDEYFGSFENSCESFHEEGFTFHGKQLTPFVWIFRACLTDA